MTAHATQREIRETLAALVARHAGVAVESIEGDISIWEHFPVSGLAEHPSVTSFVNDVHLGFDVYLTEEEWEDPTLESLAQCIRTKRENPDKSTADWNRERVERQKGFRMTIVLVSVIFGPIAFLAAAGPWKRRVWVVLGFLLFINAMLLIAYRIDTRRSRWKLGARALRSRRDRTNGD